MTELRAAVLGLRPLTRLVLLFGFGAGLLGAVVGLVIGLFAYPPTAPFAVFEVGIPALLAGLLLGLVCGSIYLGFRRLRRRWMRR